MKPHQQFDSNNPQTPDEKLISEAMDLLEQTLLGFIKLNWGSQNITHQQLEIIRDSTTGFAGSTIRHLSLLLAKVEHKREFELDARVLFENYLENI